MNTGTMQYDPGLVPFECGECGYLWWEHSSGGEICPQCGSADSIVQGDRTGG